MSAAETETVTTRYEGLIKTAQEEFDKHEESGWRLANVVYDGIEELRKQGYAVTSRDPSRDTAREKLSRDLDRHGMGPNNVVIYHRTWERYGPDGKRHPGLTFGDHLALARRIVPERPSYPAAVKALKKRSADKAAGRKPEFGNADTTITEASAACADKPTGSGSGQGPATTGRAYDAQRALTHAKSYMRILAGFNVWDYPDHQKVLDKLDEIQTVLDEVKAKPWKPSGGDAS